jgi:hypothetical protein
LTSGLTCSTVSPSVFSAGVMTDGDPIEWADCRRERSSSGDNCCGEPPWCTGELCCDRNVLGLRLFSRFRNTGVIAVMVAVMDPSGSDSAATTCANQTQDSVSPNQALVSDDTRCPHVSRFHS